MSTAGDRWAPSEAPTSAARDAGHAAATTTEARNKQRYESSVSERDNILPQPGRYYEHDDREARNSGHQEAGRRFVDSRAKPHERHGRDSTSYDRGPERDRSGSYKSRAPRDTGRWDSPDFRRPGHIGRATSHHRERSPVDRPARDRYYPQPYDKAHRAPSHWQRDRTQEEEGIHHTLHDGPSLTKDITAASRDERSKKPYPNRFSGDQPPSKQTTDWRSNGRHDSDLVPPHRIPQGAADAGGKWGHDKFQELTEDQSGADSGQYKSVLGLF